MLEAIPVLSLGIAIGGGLALLYHVVWRLRNTRQLRKDAVSRSRAVTAGKVFEQIVPYLPEFEFNPKDARFLGSPVDLVVFDGLDDGDLQRIVFVEVKTGGSGLTVRERQIREAIQDGRVAWSELRIGGRVFV